jgi:hypothetical protein
MQGHADRYTYIPMVGLSVMVAFGAAEILGKWPGTKPVIVAVACVSCVVCMALAWRQASYWQNSGTLFQHAIDTTDDNWVAECNLGIYMTASRRSSRSLRDGPAHQAGFRRGAQRPRYVPGRGRPVWGRDPPF